MVEVDFSGFAFLGGGVLSALSDIEEGGFSGTRKHPYLEITITSFGEECRSRTYHRSMHLPLLLAAEDSQI